MEQTSRPPLRLVEPEGGVTNSRLTPENGSAGLDTIRWRWRCDSGVYEDFGHRQGLIEGPRGERRALVDQGTVGVYPDGLVYLEGRAARLLAEPGDDGHWLVEPGRLPLAAREAAEAVAHEVHEELGEPTLGRADLASELRFDEGEEGLAFLHALAHVDPAWGKVGTEGMKGGLIETVAVRPVRGRVIQLRAYDKGVESGSDGPGERIRLERQLRWRKRDEGTVADFLAGDLRARFLGGLARVANAGDVVVADVVESLRLLGELPIKPARRNRLAGFLLYGGRKGDYLGADGKPSTTYYAAKAELVALGIALDPALTGRLVVPMGDYLNRLAEPWQLAA